MGDKPLDYFAPEPQPHVASEDALHEAIDERRKPRTDTPDKAAKRIYEDADGDE